MLQTVTFQPGLGGFFPYLFPPISYDDFIILNKPCYILLHFVTIFFLTSLSSPCYILLQLWIKKWADGKGVNQNHQPYVVVGRKEESPTHLCKRISEERTNSDGYYINGYRIPYDGSSRWAELWNCPTPSELEYPAYLSWYLFRKSYDII